MKRRFVPLFSRRARRERSRVVQLVRDSGLFDPDWYLRTYPDAAHGRTDPLSYFLNKGWLRGHDPGPEFSVSQYLNDNADVARAGTNPLLHFLEYGLFEGRDAAGAEPASQTLDSPAFAFAAAAPVAGFAREQTVAPAWTRGSELRSSHPFAIERDSIIFGLTDDPDMRQSIDDALNHLCRLSGRQVEQYPGFAIDHTATPLLDGWYLDMSRLRTRWKAEDLATVVRAYQVDVLADDTIRLVGEGFVSSALDSVDLQLANPLFPVLFLFSDAAGAITGWSFLVFPSLCRGGLHHAELLACGDEVPTMSNHLGSHLLDIVAARSEPAIGAVEVDLKRSDGTAPLFHRYCRSWLAKVMRLEVRAVTALHAEGIGNYLSQEVEVAGGGRSGGATLRIGHDMLPTLLTLTARASDEREKVGAAELPLLVSKATSPLQAILLQPPQHSAEATSSFADTLAWEWPRVNRGTMAGSVPAAIRYARADNRSDAQWLVPLAGARPGNEKPSITWIVEPSQWATEELAETFEALAMQVGSEAAALALVGRAEAWQRSLATNAFPRRVHSFANISEAVGAAATDLVGYLGPNVILHDNRATSFFALILRSERVATASCVLLDLERRGRQWRLGVGDGGALGIGLGGSPADCDQAVEELWGCTYAVARPPKDLWVGRSDQVKSWALADQCLAEERAQHLCTAAITASRILRGRRGSGASWPVPEVAAEEVTKFKVLL